MVLVNITFHGQATNEMWTNVCILLSFQTCRTCTNVLFLRMLIEILVFHERWASPESLMVKCMSSDLEWQLVCQIVEVDLYVFQCNVVLLLKGVYIIMIC